VSIEVRNQHAAEITAQIGAHGAPEEGDQWIADKAAELCDLLWEDGEFDRERDILAQLIGNTGKFTCTVTEMRQIVAIAKVIGDRLRPPKEKAPDAENDAGAQKEVAKPGEQSTPTLSEEASSPAKAAVDHYGLEVQFSRTPNVTSTGVMERTQAPWGMLCKALKGVREYEAKADMPLLSGAAFGPKKNGKGSLRHNENVQEVYFLTGDYDAGEVSVDEAERRAKGAGIEVAFYTTPSHKPEAPRWRVLALLSRQHKPAEHNALMDRLNGALGGVLASESWTLSQVYYYGRIKGGVYEVRHVAGAPIDLVDGITPIGKPAGAKKAKKAKKAGKQPRALPESAGNDSAPKEFSAVDMRRLESAAMHCAKNGAAGEYVSWVNNLGLPLASLKGTALEDRARDLWHRCSEVDPSYDYDQSEEKWEGFEPDEITYRTIFKLAHDSGWRDVDYEHKVDCTDTGSANYLEQIADGNLRFVPELKLWIHWNGRQWVRDETGALTRKLAGKVAKHWEGEAKECKRRSEDDALPSADRKGLAKVAETYRKWEKQCRDKNRLDAMLYELSKRSAIEIRLEKLDRNPWLLGVQNGVVDLRTGTLRAEGRDDFVTKRCSVNFIPDAKAPRWEQCVEEVTGQPIEVARDLNGAVIRSSVGKYVRREDVVGYVQRALGYSITGLSREQKMFIASGEGSNGKNVLLDILKELLGPYAVTLPPSALMTTRNGDDAERATPVLASLAGARLAITSESKEGEKLDTALVKRHTGDGHMTARKLRENTFTFEITHKLWLMTNREPGIDHLDAAMRGRLHLVKFLRRWNRPGHPEHDDTLPDGDPTLKDTLKGELEGILAWLVRGAVQYAAEGLPPPADVVKETRGYFRRQEPLVRWLEDYERCDPREGTAASALFEDFEAWARRHGFGRQVGAVNLTTFGPALEKEGVQRGRTNRQKLYGLRKAGADPAAGMEDLAETLDGEELL